MRVLGARGTQRAGSGGALTARPAMAQSIVSIGAMVLGWGWV